MQNFSKSTKWSFLSKEKLLNIKNFPLWYIFYGQRSKYVICNILGAKSDQNR